MNPKPQLLVSRYGEYFGVNHRMPGNQSALSKVIVIGASGHARVILDILKHEKRSHVVGLLDAVKPVNSEAFGYPVLGKEDDLPRFRALGLCDAAIIAIGDNWVRAQLFQRLRTMVPELRFATAIHPFSSISDDVSIGPGTVIMPGVVVNAGCRIGTGCILNTCSSLDHDSVMEDFASLAPRAVTGGGVTIGALSAICIGAVVSHSTTVGKSSVVGAGATVVKAVPDGVVAFGVPARVVRKRNPEDPYLGERTCSPSPPSATVTVFPSRQRSEVTTKLIASDNADWNNYIFRTPHDFFHRAEYHKVCEELGDSQARLIVYGNERRFVAWPIMMQTFRSPLAGLSGELTDITSVYGYSGPTTCGCDDDRSFLRSAWEAMRQIWRAMGAITVFTRFHPILRNHRFVPILRDGLDRPEFTKSEFQDGATIAIDVTQSPEAVWHGYTRQHRQAVRRLESMGVQATSDPSWEYLDDFMRLYHATMKRNSADRFYFFDKHHLYRLRDALGPHGSLMLVRKGNDIAAAALLIEYVGIVHVHLLATADHAVSLSPSKLVIHATQQWARSRGNRLVHLGGGRGSRTDDPLYRFKSGFSRTTYAFFTGRWVLNRARYEQLCSLTSGAEPQSSGTFFPIYRAPMLGTAQVQQTQ